MDYTIFNNWLQDQNNPINNLALAEWYFINNQYSASLTHYIKAFENSKKDAYSMRYHCLMMMAEVYKILGNRWLGVEQFCRFAKADQPDRPEAYEMLADIIADKLYNQGKYEQYDWIQVYENARVGLMLTKLNKGKECIYYGGEEHLAVLYCVSLLRLNKFQDLIEFLSDYEFTKYDDDYVMNTVDWLYNQLRIWNPYQGYHKVNNYDQLKVKFNNIDKIERNHSQVMQDMFVLTVLNGKTNGKYLEIGSADPMFGNNTKLLEEFGWSGVSIDFDSDFVNQFNSYRLNRALCMDAIKIDYSDLINKWYGYGCTYIDYLSIDIDPAENTYTALSRLPLDRVKFGVITFEHDSYQSGMEVREKERKLLENKGYVLIGSDIKHNNQEAFEDWWVNNEILDEVTYNKLDMMFSGSEGKVHKIFYE